MSIQFPTSFEGHIAIITDSPAQVPPEVVEREHIVVIPYPVTIGDKSYLDGVDIQSDELYQRMRNDKIIPKTSHPSIGEYLDAYRNCIERGASAVLYVALCSKLSGALATGQEAAALLKNEMPDARIEIFDTLSATASEGFVASTVAKAAMGGATMEELIAIATETRRRSGFFAMLDTLEYLALGGRIGRAASLMGNFLQVKPIVCIQTDGIVSPASVVRSHNRGLDRMIELVAGERRSPTEQLHLVFMDADAPDRREELKKRAALRLNPVDTFDVPFTAVMGTHTGPGLVGLAYHYEEPPAQA
jgi:DegV family protein with EDD domain